jgi:hypothetical protein
MKLHLLALTLAISGVCAAHQDPPNQVRVSLQWIEVPHPLLTELTSGEKLSSSAIHDAVMAHVKEGKAKIVETGIVVSRSGMRSMIDSLREEIFPTEYQPYSLGLNVPPLPEDLALMKPMNPADRSMMDRKTRNTGLTIEVEPTLSESGGIIELRLEAEVISPGRLVTWMEHKDQWGDASIKMPVYERRSIKTVFSLTNGKFELASVISPKPTQPAPAVLKKILLFVRADVITVSR